MKNPFWFNVIEQWKSMGKGEYGVTFPFLISAMANTNKKEIINNPVAGYYCEVRWCGNINEPVASIKKLEEIHKVSIKSKFICKNTQNTSLAFTTDLMSMFNLDCTSNKDCLNKLIGITLEKSLEGNYFKK